MSDYLMRGDAPLSPEEWEQLDGAVVKIARQFLVGRRFIKLVGPLGAGVEVVPLGVGENREQIPLNAIEADFKLFWRDIEASRRTGAPLELGSVAKAAAQCARAEDQAILLDGLYEKAENAVAIGDWDMPGQAFADVIAATQALVSSDCYGPYAVVLSPALFAKTQRVVEGIGRLESKLIKDVAEGGLFQSPRLEGGQGLVLSLGAHNFDLVVGQDLVTAYLGNENLDHLFRVMETVALRVKRPVAICKLTSV